MSVGAAIADRLPDDTEPASLPAELAGWLNGDGRTVRVQSPDLTAPLRELTAWASQHRLDLTGLEVGPPSLEEAYLGVIGELPGARDQQGFRQRRPAER